VAEPRQPLLGLSDESMAGVLRDLGGSIAYPSRAAEPGGVDLAARARARIVALDVRPSPGSGRRRFGFGVRPVRRGLVLAIALLLVLAAIAGAVGLGLPGLRIIFGTVPSPAPSASAARPSSLAPLGSELGLGSALPLAEVERIAGLDLILPADPAIGPPDVAYLAGERATLVWASRPGLPATGDHGVGLLISEFNGHVESGYYQKILNSGTKLTPVTVDGSAGYWISGPPHFFYYIDPNNEVVDDAHREVGDVLIWSAGEVTYRLESGLDMEAAIRIAESLD
jgi:hypothetical protein